MIKAHYLGFDHKLLLDDGMVGPVGQEKPDAAPEVSSGSDEDLSE